MLFLSRKTGWCLHLLNKHEELSIEISVNPGIPYLNLRNNISIPKRNLIDFFNSHLPLTILAVEISEGDRILRLNADKAFIYFAIRGKLTNIYLISDEESLESFKRQMKKLLLISKMKSKSIISFLNLIFRKLNLNLLNPTLSGKNIPLLVKILLMR